MSGKQKRENGQLDSSGEKRDNNQGAVSVSAAMIVSRNKPT